MHNGSHAIKLLSLTCILLVNMAQADNNVQEDIAEIRTVSTYQDIPVFGGSSSVGVTLKDDIANRSTWLEGAQLLLDGYFGWKDRLKQETGLAFAADYTAMLQGASDSLGEDEAAGGIFRFYGSWGLSGEGTANTGNLVYKVESRHNIGGELAPKSLGFEIGYAGFTAPIYADYDWGLTNLYWQQKFGDANFNLIGGVVDVTDYLGVYGLINPWTSFSNLAFLTDPTIPAPNQGLGAAAGWFATESIYLVGGVADTNGDPSQPEEFFDSFFDTGEYFTHFELGWTPAADRVYLDNVHLTYWHADERVDAATPDGWGLAFSAATFINDQWMPFLRAGYAEEGGALYDRSLSAGLGRYQASNKNLAAIGVNWSQPSESSFGPDLDDQFTLEMYYRWQLTPEFAITPDLQWIRDPALNPTENSIWVAGLRARLAL